MEHNNHRTIFIFNKLDVAAQPFELLVGIILAVIAASGDAGRIVCTGNSLIGVNYVVKHHIMYFAKVERIV